MVSLEWEEEKKSDGFARIGGVDEAGRGPLAGPVVAACVVIKSPVDPMGIDDSKKLSPKKREQLYEYILEHPDIDSGIGIVSPERIDEINILQATFEAMKKACCELEPRPDYLLIDGNQSLRWDIPDMPIVKGDQKSLSIAMASILAKVKRDHLMMELASQHPEYGFERHMGYPTKAHIEAIEKHGVLPCHRKSFGPVRALLPTFA